jgi:hypothetical protein
MSSKHAYRATEVEKHTPERSRKITAATMITIPGMELSATEKTKKPPCVKRIAVFNLRQIQYTNNLKFVGILFLW